MLESVSVRSLVASAVGGAALFGAAFAAPTGALAVETFHYQYLPAMKCRFTPMNEDGSGGELICDTVMTGPGAGANCLTSGGSVARAEDGALFCWARKNARPEPAVAGRSDDLADMRTAGGCVRDGGSATLRAGKVVCTPTPKAAVEFYLKARTAKAD